MEAPSSLKSVAVPLKSEYRWNSRLPLAVYREIVSHLTCVEGVETELISQDAPEFDYQQSQIKGICLKYPVDLPTNCQQRLEAILAYYAQRYGAWA